MEREILQKASFSCPRKVNNTSTFVAKAGGTRARILTIMLSSTRMLFLVGPLLPPINIPLLTESLVGSNLVRELDRMCWELN